MGQILIHEDYGEGELSVPSKRELCRECDGTGRTDCFDNGISSEMWSEMNGDEREEYRGGMYDAPCRECKGAKVVEVPDYDAMTPEQRKGVDDYYAEMASLAADEAAERRAGC